MKYHSIVLLLMATLIIAVFVITLIIIGFVNLNQNTSGNPPQTITISPTSTPVHRLTVTTNQTKSTQDPIIGSWLNGMVFYPNGTVGSDGTTSWEVNKNENNSYFIISDVLSPGANNPRSVTSTEWIYNPASDKINMRGSSKTFARGIPTPVPTLIPTITTIQTQLNQGVNTSPSKFNYQDCLNSCKINYVADHNIGLYNDCIQTCNIENLKVSN